MEQVQIAILGMGTIGSGVYRVIEAEREHIAHKEGLQLNVKKTLALAYSYDVPAQKRAGSIEEILEDPEISVVIELMGGKEPAKTFILRALRAGKTVVSANKELISQHWPEIEQVARENNQGFYFEAAVGGGIPILRSVQESLEANTFRSIFAIINGTTNYILTKMTDEGRDFDEVLKEAQKLGYAEANPASDVEGFDAMYKLSILASLAFHARLPVEYIYREGITHLTKLDIAYGKELGLIVKLLAIAKREGDRVELRVHPTMIPQSHPLANVKDSFNAIFLNGSAVGDVMFYGRGAGDLPTASAVIADVIASQKTKRHPYVTFHNEANTVSPVLTFDKDWLSRYFIRLSVFDKPGTFAKIATVLSEYGVSLESIIQKGSGKDLVPIIFVTHEAHELSIRSALEKLSSLGEVQRVESCIRVEK